MRSKNSFRSAPGKEQPLKISINGADALPNQEKVDISLSDLSLFTKVEPFLGSWGHHSLHPATITINDEERRVELDRFIIHRDNQHYRFWSIPDTNDYGMISIRNGIKWIFRDRFEAESTPVTELLHSSISTTGEPTQENNLLIPTPIEVPTTNFVTWRCIEDRLPAVTSITPVRFLTEKEIESDEPLWGWLKETQYVGGVRKQELLSFSEGWFQVRNSSPIARLFSSESSEREAA